MLLHRTNALVYSTAHVINGPGYYIWTVCRFYRWCTCSVHHLQPTSFRCHFGVFLHVGWVLPLCQLFTCKSADFSLNCEALLQQVVAAAEEGLGSEPGAATQVWASSKVKTMRGLVICMLGCFGVVLVAP